MTLTFHWFLPTSGDSRNITGGGHGAEVVHRDRRVTTRYLRQIATAAEEVGFVGALTPAGLWCDDAWLSTASLLDSTDRLKFLIAFRPGLLAPTLAAQMAATFQNQSGGRLLLNVVTGGEPAEQKAFGDFLSSTSGSRSSSCRAIRISRRRTGSASRCSPGWSATAGGGTRSNHECRNRPPYHSPSNPGREARRRPCAGTGRE